MSVTCFDEYVTGCDMATRARKALKTWMIIYVAFAAAVASAKASGLQSAPQTLHVPAYEESGSLIERRFFETRLAQSARTDI